MKGQTFPILDRHAKQFYEGVQVTLREGAIELGRRQVRPGFARFWFPSRVSKYRAWVIGWESLGAEPTVFLVDMSRIVISQNPTEAPEMPDWARYSCAWMWMVERAEQRGLKWWKPGVRNQKPTGVAIQTVR
jgi:hypothetical protein